MNNKIFTWVCSKNYKTISDVQLYGFLKPFSELKQIKMERRTSFLLKTEIKIGYPPRRKF